jgi:hypothetical protein
MTKLGTHIKISGNGMSLTRRISGTMGTSPGGLANQRKRSSRTRLSTSPWLSQQRSFYKNSLIGSHMSDPGQGVADSK